MKKFVKVIVIIFFFALPVYLFKFVSRLVTVMRWQTGSPLVSGHNYLRWSLVYLVFGGLFCFILYAPIILSVAKKSLKILLIPLFAAILFIIASIVFAGISSKVYNRQIIQRCDEEIRKNPNDSIPLEEKAAAYDKMGEHEKAIELYSKALGFSLKPAYVFHDRGLAYVNLQEYNKAIQNFTKAIEINQNEKDFIAQFHNDRGAAYFYNGEYDKSWLDVHKAEELGYAVNPEFINALKKASGRDR